MPGSVTYDRVPKDPSEGFRELDRERISNLFGDGLCVPLEVEMIGEALRTRRFADRKDSPLLVMAWPWIVKKGVWEGVLCAHRWVEDSSLLRRWVYACDGRLKLPLPVETTIPTWSRHRHSVIQAY